MKYGKHDFYQLSDESRKLVTRMSNAAFGIGKVNAVASSGEWESAYEAHCKAKAALVDYIVELECANVRN